MFKNLDELFTFIFVLVYIAAFLVYAFSYIFNINKTTFSLKDMLKLYYNNEDE